MKKHQKFKTYAFKLLLAAGVLIAIIFVAGLVASVALENKIANELSKVDASVASVRVNILTRSISLDQLMTASETSNLPLRGNVDKLKLSGISIFKLLTGKGIQIKNITLDSGDVAFTLSKRDSTKKTNSSYTIAVESFTVNKFHFSIKKDSVLELKAIANMSFGSFKYDSTFSLQNLGNEFHHLTGSLSQLSFSEATGFYKIFADKIEFNSEDEFLIIDSLKLTPNYGKIEFGQAKGKQVTRIDLSIPRVLLSRLNYKSLFDSILSVSQLSVEEPKLQVFRDKRLPFIKKDVVPMPMYSLLKLPFKIKIDSVSIQQATIVVEEIAEDAKTPGYVVFNNVKGLLTGLNNQAQIPTVLNATGNFMKTGLIEAEFIFPIDTTKNYTAKGKISNVPFNELNTMTGAAASLKFESGLLNNLYFNFSYNDYKSLGEVQLNYKDLKIVSLNQDKSKQKIKSALINALLKDTKDKSTPVKDRKGKIEIDRDRKRFIFNLWWKSIQSGLKDSVTGSAKK